METNTTNDRLIVRALKKSDVPALGADFTSRVMEHITRQAEKRKRQENIRQIATATIGSITLLVAAACAIRMLGGKPLGNSLCAAFSQAGSHLAQAGAKIDLPSSLHLELHPENGFLLSLCCYTAVLFIVLAITGQLLAQKYARNNGK